MAIRPSMLVISLMAWLIKGSFVRKLPTYGRLSLPAFSPSCQSHHHVNQPHHHQVVGKCNRSGTHEFRFEKILGHETQRFVRVKWLPGSLLPRLRASICKSCRQKVHRTVGRARFALENVKRLSGSDHFWTMRSTKCARDCSASSISHKTR